MAANVSNRRRRTDSHARSSSKGDDDSRFPRATWIPSTMVYNNPDASVSYCFPSVRRSFSSSSSVFSSSSSSVVLRVRIHPLPRSTLFHKSSFGADDRIHDIPTSLSRSLSLSLSLSFSRFLERRATTTWSRGRSFKVSSSHVCRRWSSFTFSARPTRVRVPFFHSCCFSGTMCLG